MIKLNDIIIEQNTFPDGTLLLKDIWNKSYHNETRITWRFESNSEVWTLIVLTKHIKSLGYKPYLNMPYVSNARMDRIKTTQDVFTLKWFAEIINSLGFESVYVLDVHSDVTPALINNCINQSPKFYIEQAIKEIEKDDSELILYFPDNGAAKRYSDMLPRYKYVVGMKKRDWETGKIKGLDIINNDIDLKGKTVLMIDDIISYGGSMFYSSLKLKEMGVNKIYAYATHTENSVLDREKGTFIKCLEDGTVEKLFTTDSLFTGKHGKIKLLESCLR